MQSDRGEIILYQSEDGSSAIDVHPKDETVWLTQKLMSSLFETERSVVIKHINNVFRTGELDKKAVCAKFAHTALDGKTYWTNYFGIKLTVSGKQGRIRVMNLGKLHRIAKACKKLLKAPSVRRYRKERFPRYNCLTIRLMAAADSKEHSESE